MTPEDERQLLETVTATNVRMKMLINEDGSHGIVPELKASHEKLETIVASNGKDWTYWKGYLRGGIAIVAFLVLAFGGLAAVVLDHILKGGGK